MFQAPMVSVTGSGAAGAILSHVCPNLYSSPRERLKKSSHLQNLSFSTPTLTNTIQCVTTTVSTGSYKNTTKLLGGLFSVLNRSRNCPQWIPDSSRLHFLSPRSCWHDRGTALFFPTTASQMPCRPAGPPGCRDRGGGAKGRCSSLT